MAIASSAANGVNGTTLTNTQAFGSTPGGAGTITQNAALLTTTFNEICDIDDDNDGITDINESGGVDPFNDADADGIPNVYDPTPGTGVPAWADSNGDGISDAFDTDRDGIINSQDLDSDNDGIPDIIEAGGTDTNYDGMADVLTDTNGDGLVDTYDPASGGISIGSKDTDGDGVPNFKDLDSDNDGIPDLIESGGVDTNGDGMIDTNSDADGNGWQNSYDPTQGGINLRTLDANGATAGGAVFDFDGDGIPNYLDLDSDNDGILDIIEQGGTDSNNDGKVDASTDTDGDGFIDTVDPLNNTSGAALGTAIITTGNTLSGQNLPTTYSAGDNLDGTGLINMLDLDADGDGILDTRESGLTGDTNNDGVIKAGDTGFADANNDGWADAIDALVALNLPNTDGRGNPNYLDIDADDDGLTDNVEGQATATYKLPLGTDADADGIDDAYDNNTAAFAGNANNGITPNNHDGTDNPDYMDSDSDNDGANDLKEGTGNGAATLTNTTDTDGDGLVDQFDTFTMLTQILSLQNNVTITGMGANGAATGPSLAGSNVVAFKSLVGAPNRDWRNNIIVLPITFLSISGTLQSATTAVISWTVAQEQGVRRYEIERSEDGGAFTTIGIQTANGLSIKQTYTYTDNSVHANNIVYRIKQISDNRTFSFSSIVRLMQRGFETGLIVYPNPATNNLVLQFYSLAAQQGKLVFSDVNGRTLVSRIVTVQKGYNSYTTAIVQRFSSGVYTVRLYADGTWQQQQFIKQ